MTNIRQTRLTGFLALQHLMALSNVQKFTWEIIHDGDNS